LPKGRLRTVKPSKVRPARMKVPTYRPHEEAGYSLDLQARKALYKTRDWYRTKARSKRKHGGKPRCMVCGKLANTFDHLVGHDDDQAVRVASALGIVALERWRDRFFEGPFVWLCQTHHSSKTRAEMDGKLLDWLRDYRSSGGAS